MPFSNLGPEGHAWLTRRAEAVEDAAPVHVHTITFRTSGIPLTAEPRSISERLEEWTKLSRRWIYIFDTTATQAERKELAASFSAAKAAKTPRFRYARLNDPLAESSVLYVGSSESLKSRIRNHLGYLVGPSSLNMGHWMNMPDIEVRLRAARYPDSLPKEALCDLEDCLSVSMSPVFGKRGSAQ